MTGAFTRRRFIELGAAGVALIATGTVGATNSSATPVLRADRRRDDPWVETDLNELQRMLRQGRLSSRELTEGYLARIRRLNPTLHAVIETNPEAVKSPIASTGSVASGTCAVHCTASR